jgi:hypothetical protein
MPALLLQIILLDASLLSIHPQCLHYPSRIGNQSAQAEFLGHRIMPDNQA